MAQWQWSWAWRLTCVRYSCFSGPLQSSRCYEPLLLILSFPLNTYFLLCVQSSEGHKRYVAFRNIRGEWRLNVLCGATLQNCFVQQARAQLSALYGPVNKCEKSTRIASRYVLKGSPSHGYLCSLIAMQGKFWWVMGDGSMAIILKERMALFSCLNVAAISSSCFSCFLDQENRKNTRPGKFHKPMRVVNWVNSVYLEHSGVRTVRSG